MWETIQYITTPLTLIAFVGALVTIAYRRKLESKKELINSAEAADRAKLIEASLETYHLKDDNLTKEQKFELVKKLLDQKIQRLKINSITLILLAVIFAVTALIGFRMMNDNSKANSNNNTPKVDSSKTSLTIFKTFIKISDQAIKQKTILPNKPLPTLFSEARNRFENYWSKAGFDEKHLTPDSIVYEAVSNNIRIYRIQETYDKTKSNTNEWINQGIDFFKNSNTNKYFSDLLLEKAAVILEMSEQSRSDKTLFRNLVKEGDKIMMKAYSIQDENSKGKILRIWSRFYYDLSKPETNIYSGIWDNTYLNQAYQKSLQAFSTDTNLLKNSTQLCRCLQKLSSNPPQESDSKWISVMQNAFNKHVSLWSIADKKLTEYTDRIPPLNILAVLGFETALREWDTSHNNSTLAKRLLRTIDSIILPSQEEVAVLVESSEYKKEYSADVYIDLSKIHVLKFLLLSYINNKDDNKEFDQVVVNIRKAKSSIKSIDQLDALKISLDTERIFTKLKIPRRNELKKLLA